MVAAQVQTRQCDNILVDLGSVLFTWSANTMSPVRPKLLRRILSSTVWFEYEKGNITEQECIQLVAAEFSVFEVDFARALKNARRSIRLNHAVFDTLRDLKKKRAGVRVFAVANMSSTEWDFLRRKLEPEVWALFEHVYTSADVGERKPNLGFFKHVVNSAGLDAARTVLVDNRVENVVSGMSVGMKGVAFTTVEDMSHALAAATREVVADAQRWMRQHAQEMWSVTDTGVTLEDNFGQLMILDVTEDASLANIVPPARLANFFRGRSVLTTEGFPDDLNTTSTACTALSAFRQEMKDDIIEEMLSIRTREGLIPTYFDTTRPRIDPVVNVNVLTFLHLNGRGHELPEALDWVHSVLHTRAYEHGTRYFATGDAFLYFLSRLISVSPSVRQRLGKLFVERVRERCGAEGDALALGMRVVAAASVGVRATRDCERLVEMQEEDGSWPVGWMYKYGSHGVRIGNKGLTTAMAVAAISKCRGL